jgi:hypothetical protein
MTTHAAARYLPKPKAERDGIGLCLSGGGYRAALFHLGALRRLNEFGMLARLRTISSVSGGSIIFSASMGFPEVVYSGQLGLEQSPRTGRYAEPDVFMEVRRPASPRAHRWVVSVHLDYVLQVKRSEIKDHHDEVLRQVVEVPVRQGNPQFLGSLAHSFPYSGRVAGQIFMEALGRDEVRLGVLLPHDPEILEPAGIFFRQLGDWRLGGRWRREAAWGRVVQAGRLNAHLFHELEIALGHIPSSQP